MALQKVELLDALQPVSRKMRGLAAIKSRYRPLVCPLGAVLDEIPEHARLYDIGCGAGILMYLALQLRGAELAHGHDVSNEAIRSGQTLIDVQPGMRAKVLHESEFPSLAGYDVVTLVDVLHHIPTAEQAAFLTRVAVGMDEGARLLVLDIDAGRLMRAVANQVHDLLLARDWVHPVRPSWTVNVRENAGLTVAPPRLFSTLWYGHYLVTAVKQGKAS